MTQPIKLLFVDDDRHVLKSLLRLFDDKDYEVYGVLSGEEGLDILSLHPDIKIVVSDYMMPVMTGVEFLKKAARIAPNVVRIILTEHEETKVLVAL